MIGFAHRRRRAGAERGFTLIELMVSLVIFSFAMVGLLAVAVTMVTGFREQRMNVETEGAARGAMEFLADVVRGASPAVESGEIEHVDNCTSKGAFTVTNYTGAPDELTVVYASGAVVTSLQSVYDATTTSITLADQGDQFTAGDTILITNYDQGHLVRVTAVTGNVLTVGSPVCALAFALPTGGYPIGSLVVRAQRARFYIANDATTGIPTLFMDPDAEGNATAEPLAEGIEDMQISVGVDANNDGNVPFVGTAGNDDEWAYNVAGDSPIDFTVYPKIRGVRITLTARSTGLVPNGAYYRLAAGDRPAATAPDGYRRRVLSSTIEVRNMGGSP